MKRTLIALCAAVVSLPIGGCAPSGGSAAQDIAPSETVTVTASPSPSEPPSPSNSPSSTKTPKPPPPPGLGDKQLSDLGAVTVYAVEFPVEPQDSSATRISTKGMQFAVADIKVCSNGSTTSDGYQYSPDEFVVVDRQDRSYSFWNVQISARNPDLTDSLFDNMKAGMCTRGWITYELPSGTKVRELAYTPYEGAPLVWQAERNGGG